MPKILGANHTGPVPEGPAKMDDLWRPSCRIMDMRLGFDPPGSAVREFFLPHKSSVNLVALSPLDRHTRTCGGRFYLISITGRCRQLNLLGVCPEIFPDDWPADPRFSVSSRSWRHCGFRACRISAMKAGRDHALQSQ